MKIKYLLLSMTAFLTIAQALPAKVRVVTTSTDLASIARSIGGNHVTVESLTAGNTDLHYAQARPDFIMKLNRADVFIEVGLELEVGWSPLLLNQSRNPKIHRGSPGYCIAHRGIALLEKPAGEITRQMGDIHPYGNPHYWTDPVNGIIIARNVRDTLKAVDPSNRGAYESAFNDFSKKALEKTKELQSLMGRHRGKSVVTYHSEFVYLLGRFGLKQSLMIEELPGVSPSPARARLAVEHIRKNGITLVLVSPWSNLGVAGKIAREGGARLVVLPIQTASASGTETYLKMVETAVKLLDEGLSR